MQTLGNKDARQYQVLLVFGTRKVMAISMKPILLQQSHAPSQADFSIRKKVGQTNAACQIRDWRDCQIPSIPRGWRQMLRSPAPLTRIALAAFGDAERGDLAQFNRLFFRGLEGVKQAVVIQDVFLDLLPRPCR